MTETPQVHASFDDDRTLCKLAVRHKMLTAEQARSVLTLAARARKRGREVGAEQVLRSKGWIGPRQLDALRKARDLLKLRAGERLYAQEVLGNGLASRERVDEALREQTRLFKNTGRFMALEEILKELGYLGGIETPAAARMPAGGLEPGHRGPSDFETASQAVFARDEPTGQPTPSEVRTGAGEESAEHSDRLGHVVYRDSTLDVIVSDDAMQAYLRLKGGTASDLTVDRLVSLLQSKGIAYGILDGHLLARGLKQRSQKSIVFKVAQGAAPKPGRDAGIRYFLTSEPETLQEATRTDPRSLKDRGLVLRVKEGDLLAEKAPRVPGMDGIDVYGKPIVVPEAKEISLLYGSGVLMSEDGLRASAKVDGRVMVTPYGKLTVLEEHTVRGDVSFETGNVDFMGIVYVHGVVQDGFRVRCGSLVCNEIGRAEIDSAGDVTVHGGVLGAQVRCQGDLKCAHIHASRVEALGDVIAEKGIVDSKVKTSGKCVVKSGTTAASLVYAKEGIDAAQIGHERSRPCTLAIGFDPVMEKVLDGLKESLAAKEAEARQLAVAFEELRQQRLRAEERTGELAQLQDRTLRERRFTLGMLDDARKAENVTLVREFEAAVAELDAKARETEQELDELLEMQDQLNKVSRAHREKLRDIEKEIESFKEELAVMTSWGQGVPPDAAVRVQGKVYAGTSIRGPCSIVTLNDTLSGVSIRETVVDSTSGERIMRVARLR